jgi:hypothetical protein
VLNTGFAGCYIRPLRGVAATTAVYYSPSTSELTYLTSSVTTKNTIEPLTMDTSAVYGLAPKTYHYNTDPEAGLQVGYIAEEVALLNKHLATHDVTDGNPIAIDYNTVVVFLVEEVKKLREKVRQLEAR